MAEATVERFGGIDLLVNNAAIYGTMEFDLLITVNIAAALAILLASMYVRRPLDFAIFPALLLVATLGGGVVGASMQHSSWPACGRKCARSRPVHTA